MKYVDISAPLELSAKVKQTLKFRTGRFVWRIKFNVPLKLSSIDKNSIFVTDENNLILKTNISYNKSLGVIEIEPIDEYTKDKDYFLNITNKVTSKSGKSLSKDVKIKFKL